MKRIWTRVVAFVLVAALSMGFMPVEALAAEEQIYHLANDYIKVDVSGANGGFHIDTVLGDKLEKDDDNKLLLHNSGEYDTSFTSFRITKNGKSKDYIFGRNYGFLGMAGSDLATTKEGQRILSTWTVENVKITQSIELANASSAENGMVLISYTAENLGEAPVNVQARIMLDTALGYQDYAYYKIPQDGVYETIERETVLEGGAYGHMLFGYDNEFNPSTTAYTVNASVANQECVPSKVAFGHWNNLAATVFDFTPNGDLTFTNQYNAQYLTADSAYALYYDLGSLEAKASQSIATNYGVYSNAQVGQETRLAINIAGANPMKLNADKSGYVSADPGDKPGELTLTASIKNFASDSAKELKNVRVAVYTDDTMVPLDSAGNPHPYQPGSPYYVDYSSIQVEQTMTTDFRFRPEVLSEASYRKIELVAYQLQEDTTVLLEENIIGRQSVYILCPGADNGIPDVVLTGCTEMVYYTGKQHIYATGLRLHLLADKSTYDFALRRVVDGKLTGEQITIPSETANIDTEKQTLDITLPAAVNEDTGEPQKWPLGTYQLTIDYKDKDKTDVVCTAAQVTMTDDPQYANLGYGVLAVVQTNQPTDPKDCKYEVRAYATEKAYQSWLEGEGENTEVLVELKGEFSEKRFDERGNAYYMGSVVEGSDSRILLNNAMELRSGNIRVTVETKDKNGKDKKQSILVDVDGNMRIFGTGTPVFNGTAALTAITDGMDFELRKYTTNGIRCSTLDNKKPAYQDMTDKQTITYIFSKTFDTFVTLANALNADLTYGELGMMVDEYGGEITKLASFGARIDLGLLVPKGSKEFKESYDSAWGSFTSDLKGSVKGQTPTSGSLRSSWKTFKESDYAHEYAKRKAAGLIQACAEVEDVLFGNGECIGVSFSVNIGLPPLTTNMPPLKGVLTVNTMGDWRFGVDGYVDFAGLTVEASLEVIYSQEDKAPIPNKLYFYMETPPPGLNVDGFGVVWLRGGGGGIDNLYEAVYASSTLPSTSILLSVGASVIQVINAKITMEMSLRGLSIIAERATLGDSDIIVLRNSGIRLQWYPDFQFIGNVNLDFLGILNGSGYIVVDPSVGNYEFYAMVSLMTPPVLPLIGGKVIGRVGVGVNQDKIWGKATIIGLTFGIVYYWGGDFSFVQGDGKGLDPTYPDLLSRSMPVAYDAESGQTLYAAMVPNVSMVVQSETMLGALAAADMDLSEAFLKSDVTREHHKLCLGTYGSASGALSIKFPAESEEQARELAGKITVEGKDLEFDTATKDNPNPSPNANAFMTYAPEAKEASVVISFTADTDFGREWSITTEGVPADLELYNVKNLPAFGLTEGSKIEGTTATLTWDVANGNKADIDRISVVAVKDPEDQDGVLLGVIEDNIVLESGSTTLELPKHMASGEYYLKAVASMSGDTLVDTSVTASKFSFVNANQPSAPTAVTAANTGDYRLAVTADGTGDAFDGYQVNVYEVTGEGPVQVAYASNSVFEKDEAIVVGGQFESAIPTDPEDPTAETTTAKTVGLMAGKQYQVGVRRVKYLLDPDSGEQTAMVLSEETFSQVVTLAQPQKPRVTISVTGSGGSAAKQVVSGAVQTETGTVEIKLPTVTTDGARLHVTSNMPISGQWYLDNINYGAAQKNAKDRAAGAMAGDFTAVGDFTIDLAGLETQEHTLYLDGQNAGGDGFSETFRFVVDTQAPTLALTSPLNGMASEADDTVTLTGLADPTAALKVEVNGKSLGEKPLTQWDSDTEGGVFAIPGIQVDGGLLRNTVTLTATDAAGNTSRKTVTVLNPRLGQVDSVDVCLDGQVVTNAKLDTSAALSGELTLVMNTVKGESFEVNDPALIEWSAFMVNGDVRVLEAGEAISLLSNTDRRLEVDRYGEGMLVGVYRLTKDAGFSAAVSFGRDTENAQAITYTVPKGAAVTVTPQTAKPGEVVTVSVTPAPGYVFVEWQSQPAVAFANKNAATTTFPMPASGSVHLTPVVRNTAVASYTVTFEANGGSPVASQTVAEGATVAKPADSTREGYTFAGWFSDAELTIPYDFSTPVAGDLILYAKWRRNVTPPDPSWPITPPDTSDGGQEIPQVPEETELPFLDVPDGAWYKAPVRYVYENGLMNGTSATLFSPHQATSRGMIVTILHRLEGSPAPARPAVYADVPDSAWYAGAVQWASAGGIVTGYGNGLFGPNDAITREQLAAILYRYAGTPAVSDADRTLLSGFPDEASISGYARDPMAWAVAAGIISGTDQGTLAPKGQATRAQVAAMLQRFLESRTN